MALFSRRPASTPDEHAGDDVPAQDTGEHTAADDVSGRTVPQVTEPAGGDGAAESPDAAASVNISVSSFRGLGASQPSAPAAPVDEGAAPTASDTAPAASGSTPAAPAPTARPQAETVPGLRDNVLLRESLAKLPENPNPQELLDLARQVLQGHLFLRVKGDARVLIAEGKNLPLAVASIGERRFALAYSSGAALTASIRADGDANTSAVGQPAITVLRHVRDGELEGLVIDPASAPARAILPRALIERMLAAVDENLAVKTLLAQERTDATAASVVDALTRSPLWVAVNTPEDGSPVGVAEGRAKDGSRFLELYSHPLEVVAMGRGDRAAPLSAAQLAATLRADPELAGVLVDPRGPWIRLGREDLAPVLALEE